MLRVLLEILADVEFKPLTANLLLQVLSAIQTALARRSVASTACNAGSSRSHCLVYLIVATHMGDGRVQHSKLCLVDLAGMEVDLAVTEADEQVDEAGIEVDLAVTEFDMADKQVDLAGTDVNLAGDKMHLLGTEVDLAGMELDLAGIEMDLTANPVDLATEQVG